MTQSHSAFPLASLFQWLFVVFALAKLASSAALLLMGDFRAEDTSAFRRFARITSKITVSLACLSLAGAKYLQHKPMEALALTVLALAIAGFAAFVLRLRKQRRFFGLAEQMQQFMSPAQVKALWIVVFGGVLFALLRNLN